MKTLLVFLLCILFSAGICTSPALLSGARVVPDAQGRVLDRAFIDCGSASPVLDANKSVAFRRTFNLAAKPKSARLCLFANSRYVLWVNGSYVDRGPGRFERSAPQYDVLDVSRYLVTGKNSLAILVTGPLSNGKIQWAPLALTAELIAGEYNLLTDSHWKWSDRTRYRSAVADWPNVYDLADARVENGDWTRTSYDDSEWSHAVSTKVVARAIHPMASVDGSKLELNIEPIHLPDGRLAWFGPLTARTTPLLRETTVHPHWAGHFPITLMAGESIAFKFSRLVLAYLKLKIHAESGSEIEWTYSPNSHYICRTGNQDYMTTDTQAVFEGAIRIKSGKVTLKKVEFVERLYPFDRLGSFHSNDQLLNKLWTTCVRGLEVVSEDSYVDCADRERVEWMDVDPPSFDVTRVAMAGPAIGGRPAYSDPRLLAAMLRRTAYSLQPGGWVKAHTCSNRFDIHAKMEDRACDWIEGARRYYESSGDTKVIDEIWPAVVTQLNYFLDRRSERGLVFAREWGVWGNPVAYQHCEGTILNAFVYKALVDAAFLGKVIGKKVDSKLFAGAASKIAAAMNNLLWDESSGTYFAGYYDADKAKAADPTRPLNLRVTNHLIEPTMNAALFALDQGIVPAARLSRVKAYLLARPPKDNYIMQYYYYFKQQYLADDSGQDAAVLATLRAEWEDMANSRYEATFEGLHASGSSAHGYGMFPAYFLSSYVLGVRLDGIASQNVLLIEPRLANLHKAAGTVVTELGLVHVGWKQGVDGLSFEVDSPKNCDLKIRLPAGPEGKVIGLLGGRRVGRWIEFRVKGGKYSGKSM